MKRLTILLLALCCLSCKHSNRKINPVAIRLNKDAQVLFEEPGWGQDHQNLQDAIVLLNKAIQKDSSYSEPYFNKFIFQNALKQYSNAIITGKQFLKLRPDQANMKLMVGEDYEKTGDTISSVKYYKDALTAYNKTLDTVRSSFINFTSASSTAWFLRMPRVVTCACTQR